MTKRVLKVDDLTRPDHFYLNDDDVCFYAGEYTAGEGHAYSETNQLIHNFKKDMDTIGTTQWQYKLSAIQQAAEIFRSAIKPDAQITFVPVPPSKQKSDPLYDNRMLLLLQAICVNRTADIRELVLQRQSTEATHHILTRPTPDDLLANYCFDESLVEPIPEIIFVVDDVLTTGCHYKAMKHMLTERFPSAQVVGLFIARRAPKSVDMEINITK